MDSARDFDLLGESVPQVRVSARTLALWGFFNMIYIYILEGLLTSQNGLIEEVFIREGEGGSMIWSESDLAQ